MENSNTDPQTQEPPSLGWVRALRFFLIVVAPPLLAGEASRHLFPRFEPLVAYYLAAFACFFLWCWLEDRR